MPIYRQGQIFTEPRRSGLGATVVGALQGMQEGKELGRKEAQKDIQNIIENPQLAQYVDKDKLQKQAKRGYGETSITGSALANALTEGGLATTEGTYRTIEQAREAGKNPPEGQRFTGEIEEYDVGGVPQYAPVFEAKEWELIEGKDFYWRYNSSTGEKEKTNIPVPPETTLGGVTFKNPKSSNINKITKEKEYTSKQRSKINYYKEKYPNRSEEEIIKAMKEKGIL